VLSPATLCISVDPLVHRQTDVFEPAIGYVRKVKWFERELEWLRSLNPLLIDALLAVLATTIGIATVFAQDLSEGMTEPTALAVITTCVTCAPVAIRRPTPLLALVISSAGILGHIASDYPEGSLPLVVLFLTYTVAASSPLRRAIAGLGAVYITLILLWLSDAAELDTISVVANLATFGAVWAVGVAVRARRDAADLQVREAEERANVERQHAGRVLAEERLRALGTLTAGLAHELNNPASAATRAVDTLQETCDTLLTSMMDLAEGSLSAEQFVALDALRREIDSSSASVEPLAVADREDALIDWLDARDVDQSWRIAPPLALAGVNTTWCEQVAELLDSASLGTGLEWVASTLSTTTLLSEIKESTGRVSDLVSTMGSYSQLDRAPLQDIDVTEGIESTLVILGEKLHDGITVVRDYADDMPRIEAIPGELNQVWTNLIDNAIDAMEGEGTLRASTRIEGEHVVVEVADTGSGMPPDVQARAFEPFFTTKDVGKGTGLGLDTSRRIVVERHDGEILVASQPGETVVTVKLPIRRT
jgi:signal transduction histidine kinase